MLIAEKDVVVCHEILCFLCKDRRGRAESRLSGQDGDLYSNIGGNVSKPLALIVEDEYDISIVFAMAIEAAGFETEIIRDGMAALSWLASAEPDLVLLDLNLPGVDGTGILKHIRDDPRLAKVTVAVVTAYSHRAKSIHDDADWVFFKPVSFGDLRDMAARIGSGAKSEKTNGGTTT